MGEYVDIQEAMELTDRSYSTIRNFIGGLSKDEKKEHTKKRGQKILISKDFLASKYELKEEIEDSRDILIQRLVSILEKDLEEKNRQLKESQQITKMTLLNDLASKNASPELLKKVLGISDEEVRQIIEIGKSNKRLK